MSLLADRPVIPCTDVPALLPVTGAELQVPLATGGTRRYVNLDYAASAPSLVAVEDTLAQALPWYASVHRGAGWASQVSTRVYEGSRERIAAAFGARSDDVVVFTRNTTDALNLLATTVPTGDVLLLDLEHHANLLPWQRVSHKVLVAAPTLVETVAALEQALATGRFSLLSITGASNVTGEVLPIRQLAELAHAYGARIAVDAAQLAPHRPISLQDSGVDYLAMSAHKVYAPHGAGVLIGRRDWLDQADPYLAGGGAVVNVAIEETTWAPAPQRHEAGTPNVLGALALAVAVDALSRLAPGALEAHERALRDRLLDGLAGIEGVTVHRIWSDCPDTIGVVTFSLEGYDPGFLAAVLSAEHGIGVRDGKFCAHPLLARLGLAHGAVRASFGVGSTSDDVARLVAALGEIATHGPRLDYELVAGRFAPVADPRQLPGWLSALAGDDAGAPAGVSPCQA